MPGAPNRPPETHGPAPPPVPVVEPPERKVLRRLVPSHVALLQETWKGAVPPEVLAPFEKAEGAVAASDLAGATTALDLLSIRFAEPRWPTLADPFRRLRVPIPAPVPPHWDPDHDLSPAEKDARRAQRVAEEQVELARASLAWAAAHGVEVDRLAALIDEAQTALTAGRPPPEILEKVDGFWAELRPRLPRPKSSRAPPAPASPAAGPEGA